MRRKICEPDVRIVQSEPPKKKSKVVLEINADEVKLTDDPELPNGLILKDVKGFKWKIGRPIGRGSFGRIYLASNILTKEANPDNAKYVVKIEPHDNGPLFVELNCLVRNCRSHLIRKWKELKSAKSIGVPQYISHGSHNVHGARYRFLVLPRYDRDLQSIIEKNDNVLELRNVLVLAYQILEVLEYLHARGYTHCDIKSSNLMVGFDGTAIEKTVKRLESRKVSIKRNRSRLRCNYYDDEDFDIEEYASDSSEEEGNRRKLAHILKDPKVRRQHRNHAFNLRQLHTSVNYEDLDGSVCSDLSYQANPADEAKSCSETSASDDSTYADAVLPQNNRQIYLLDYGLASKFLNADGVHKEFGMDQRKAHDGTLTYSSLDSHIGAHSRRSDLESLGYNLLEWLSGRLPWKSPEMQADPDLVHALKKNYMKDVKVLLTTCFKSDSYPYFLEKYLSYASRLEFSEEPDYEYCKELFKSEFLKLQLGDERDFVLKLDGVDRVRKNYSKKLGPPKKLRNLENNIMITENDLKLEIFKTTNDGFRKPCTLRNFFVSDANLVAKLKQSLLTPSKKFSPKKLRSQKAPPRKKKGGARNRRSNIGKFGQFLGSGKQFTWAEILAGNPEEILRKDKKTDDDANAHTRNRKASNASETCPDSHSALVQKNFLNGLNPTYAMREVYANFRKKLTGKKVDPPEVDSAYDGHTSAMIAVLEAIKSKNKKAKKPQTETTATKPKEKPARTARKPPTTPELTVQTRGSHGVKKCNLKYAINEKNTVAKSTPPSTPLKKDAPKSSSTKVRAKKSHVVTRTSNRTKSTRSGLKYSSATL